MLDSTYLIQEADDENISDYNFNLIQLVTIDQQLV